MSPSLCQLLELSLLLISTPEAEGTLLEPRVSSRRAAQLRVARAKYCERNKAVEAEKARIRMARYRAKIKANANTAEEYRQRALEHDAAYRTKYIARSWNSSPGKLKSFFTEREARRENPRDYEVEWEVYKAQRMRITRMSFAARWRMHAMSLLQMSVGLTFATPYTKVSVAAVELGAKRALDGLLLFSLPMAESSPYYCSPPVHPDPGAPRNAVKAFYLVTCPAARSPGPGIYSSWTSAQRVVTGISHGVAVSYPSIQACLPAWHAGCEAGEHNHRASPDLQRDNVSASPRYMPQNPQTPRKPTKTLVPASPSTGRGIGFVKSPAPGSGPRVSITTSMPPAHATAATTPFPATPVSKHRIPALGNSFAVRGGGVVHSSLTTALAQYQTAATASAASVCTMADARTAAYFAASHSIGQARAMAKGDRAVMMYEEWAEGPSRESAVCRLRHDELVEQLEAALEALSAEDVAAPDSDFEDLSDDDQSSILTYISD
ncbi:hypothetical protein C8R44DRAFT_729307 [Mycena epipterygia]|nr:hypothetical protein C8R44DRAFT_729307 [Mycena epipterygia]